MFRTGRRLAALAELVRGEVLRELDALLAAAEAAAAGAGLCAGLCVLPAAFCAALDAARPLFPELDFAPKVRQCLRGRRRARAAHPGAGVFIGQAGTAVPARMLRALRRFLAGAAPRPAAAAPGQCPQTGGGGAPSPRKRAAGRGSPGPGSSGSDGEDAPGAPGKRLRPA